MLTGILLGVACSQPGAGIDTENEKKEVQLQEQSISKSTSEITEWIRSKVYYATDQCTWKGNTWEAKWYTQGQEPGTTGQWGVWKLADPVEEDTEKPSVPQNLAASLITSTSVTLNWTASTDNKGVTGYKITKNGLETAQAVSNQAVISALTPNTEYSFSVIAFDAAGNNSDPSVVITVTTEPDNPIESGAPFPVNQSTGYSYYAGCTSPYGFEKMNNDVKATYSSWASNFLRPYTINSTSGQKEGYIIEADGTGGEDLGWNYSTQSEAHGYGMIVLAIMSGSGVLESLPAFGQNEQYYFDRMTEVVVNFKSEQGSNMMQWALPVDGQTGKTTSSATDGDFDIIYALLLADKQWGSTGAHNYRAIALTMLNSVFSNSRNNTLVEQLGSEYWVKIGDWAQDWGAGYTYNDITRPSDWLLSNFRSFAAVSSSSQWNKTIDDTYSKLFYMADTYSSQYSLMPDFVTGNAQDSSKPYGPAYDGWWKTHEPTSSLNNLEGTADGSYYYNACRYPWRIGADIILYNGSNETQAKNRLVKLAHFFENTPPANVWDGYRLDGTEIPKSQMPDPVEDGVRGKKCFVAPIAVAFLATNGHQGSNFTPQLQSYWDYMAAEPAGVEAKYYSSSVNLLNMLLISGNWWNPESR